MEDPLSKPFDLLVCGSGLVESIVAASAAVRGLRVLHVDGNSFYGDWDATVPLPQLVDLLRGTGLTGSRLCAHGEVGALPASLSPRTLRSILVDLRPRLLLAQGKAASLLVASDAARYLTYRRLGACSVAPSGASTPQPAPIRVPANKGDVFLNPGLTLLEKRSVMRFLQAANDGVSLHSLEQQELAEVESLGIPIAAAAEASGDAPQQQQEQLQRLNEALLGSGRSLLRPQNKAVLGLDEGAFAHRSMSDLLCQGAELSPRVVGLFLGALALWGGEGPHPYPSLTGACGMARVRGYLAALSRYGGTAFLAHEYGCGALCEAFCRLAAVHGGVYMLGFAPAQWEPVGEGEEGGGLRVRLHCADAQGGGAEDLQVTVRRALVSPAYAPFSHGPALVPSATVVCLCIIRDGSGDSEEPGPSTAHVSTASSHTVITPSPHRPFTVHVLEQGCDDRVAPRGFRVMYFYCLVGLGEAQRVAEALREEANSGAWFSPAVPSSEEGGAAPAAPGDGAGCAPAASIASTGARVLLWQACYSLSSAGGAAQDGSPAAASSAAAYSAAASFAAVDPTIVHVSPTEGPPSTWQGCCVHSEELVSLAEHAHAKLFPQAPKLFAVREGAGKAVEEVSPPPEAGPLESGPAEGGASGEQLGSTPGTQAAAVLSDLEEALALLKAEPLDL